ncbi:hypothetical protein [Aquitalea sp. ASV15]|uniref:hypothetical protein n=1 Tax=Aquitalea sp. ASV15 TaxID=2795104 RepID=UPI0018EA7A38|nr:hypothetical protein [Aquitalea sp. ASV15]
MKAQLNRAGLFALGMALVLMSLHKPPAGGFIASEEAKAKQYYAVTDGWLTLQYAIFALLAAVQAAFSCC